jgi:hypothetical protein
MRQQVETACSNEPLRDRRNIRLYFVQLKCVKKPNFFFNWNICSRVKNVGLQAALNECIENGEKFERDKIGNFFFFWGGDIFNYER